LTAKIKKLLERLTEVIVREYQPEKIILFGSYAYGKPDEESDIDLLIIKETDKSFFNRLFEVRKIASDTRRGYPFEPVVMTPKELEKRLKIGDQFFEEILSKGKILYAK